MKPTFIGIGAQKCASTWIHDILRSHPEVSVPDGDVKEVDFFSFRYENGFRWYESLFNEDRPIRGEISPSYLYDAAACARARTYSPGLKILLSLRDPVERALSQHRHMVRLGYVDEADLSFEAAMATNPTYIEQGMYFTHISRWLDAFGESRVLVVLLEDIQADGPRVAKCVYSFLGADTSHVAPALHLKSNASYVAKNRAIENTVRACRKAARTLGVGPLWQKLGDSGLRQAYRSINRRESNSVIPEPRPETIQQLRSVYREDIARLAGLLDRDLSSWMTS